MNRYFYFQPRNFRFLDETEGCASRHSLKPEMKFAFGVVAATTAAVVGAGAAVYGAVASNQARQKAKGQADAAMNQSVTQQIANLNDQVSADQAAIDTSKSSAKNWEYVTLGGVALVIVAGGIYLLKRKK